MDKEARAIVIGAGVAGLAAAIRLAVQGFRVDVYEKNNYPGGKLSAFELNGYRFDAGPSLFTQPSNIEELFVLANEPIESYFQYSSLPVACTYFYEDGTMLSSFTEAERFAKELHEKNGEDVSAVMNYLKNSEQLYNNVGKLFLDHSLHQVSTLRAPGIGKALQTVRFKHVAQSMHSFNKQQFRSHRTVQLFNRYATYNGSDPYQAPAMLTLIPHLEHNEGTFYPKGGMIAITEALYQLALKKGVRFYFESPVERIIQSGHKIQGVVVKGEHKYASVVVSNMDVYFTYKHLLQNEAKAAGILKQERSSSALIFYWGIQRNFASLGLHNIFFSADYQAEFEHIFSLKKVYNDPTVYVNITSKCEPGIQAPPGKENWFVMVNVPANSGQDWKQIQTECRTAVIQKLNRLLKTDIAQLIEVEEHLDPVTIESKTASYMGSLYGTSSNSRMAAFLRHPNFSSALKGLYFVGGSVHPGGGIPLCLRSAKITSELIRKDLQRK
ncbi:MAG: phytoene desaturase [Bacteroidota bacterium]|nr:phytoene desaturase [Bacteroidota bacterium]